MGDYFFLDGIDDEGNRGFKNCEKKFQTSKKIEYFLEETLLIFHAYDMAHTFTKYK